MWLASHCRIGVENMNLSPNPALGPSLRCPPAHKQQASEGAQGHQGQGWVRVDWLRREHSNRLLRILASYGAAARRHHDYRNEEQYRSPHDQPEHTNGDAAQKDANRMGLNRNVGFTPLLSKVGGHGETGSAEKAAHSRDLRADLIVARGVKKVSGPRYHMTFVTPCR